MDISTLEQLLDQGGLFVLTIVLLYFGKTVIEWYREDSKKMLDVMIEYTKEQAKFNTLLQSLEEEFEDNEDK